MKAIGRPSLFFYKDCLESILSMVEKIPRLAKYDFFHLDPAIVILSCIGYIIRHY